MSSEIRTFKIRDAAVHEDELALGEFLRTVDVARIETTYTGDAWHILVMFEEFVDGVLKYHRTVATYLNTLTENGLTIRKVLEPEAQPEYLAERPALADESRRPPLMVVSAQKLA